MKIKGIQHGPDIPPPIFAIGFGLAIIVLASVTTARAGERPMGTQDGPDPLGAIITCVSDGESEITLDPASSATVADLAALCDDAPIKVASAPAGTFGTESDVVLDDGAPFSACSSVVDCATHCTTLGASRGGARTSSLVADVRSSATGDRCDCTFGNGQTSTTICVSPIERPRR